MKTNKPSKKHKDLKEELEHLKSIGEAPIWMNDESYITLIGGYLLEDETPKGMYRRIADSAGEYSKKPELKDKFFQYMWNNWLCPSTPVAANTGTDRGLNISCFSSCPPDSTYGLMQSFTEIAMLSKYGGGTAMHFNNIRAKGTKISKGGVSDGTVPFMKMADSVISGISQGGVRRGATALYQDIEHGDFDEFINIRKPNGDLNRKCMNIHHGICISDEFMQKVIDGDHEARDKWKEVIKTRFETGEPYIFFKDTVNKSNPSSYKELGLDVKGSNLCSEITLHTDSEHTFVCCLSSLNLAKWDEWKDTDLVQTSIVFLDSILEEFIDKAKKLNGFDNAVRFSIKSRALGLGVLGFHTLLQSKNLAFDELQTYLLNKVIFKHMQSEAIIASKKLAEEFGEPEWCKDTGMRNTHLMALAPTVSNSLISSNVSAGIEPWAANAFSQKSAKGTFTRKNPELVKLLIKLNKNDDETWKSIVNSEGSVQHLDFLSEQEKKVFQTAREINQFVIVGLAADRQKFIDQSQSLNLFFPANSDAAYINDVHIKAWQSGVKTLYYCRTSSVLKGESGSREYKRESTECTMCEG